MRHPALLAVLAFGLCIDKADACHCCRVRRCCCGQNSSSSPSSRPVSLTPANPNPQTPVGSGGPAPTRSDSGRGGPQSAADQVNSDRATQLDRIEAMLLQKSGKTPQSAALAVLATSVLGEIAKDAFDEVGPELLDDFKASFKKALAGIPVNSNTPKSAPVGGAVVPKTAPAVAAPVPNPPGADVVKTITDNSDVIAKAIADSLVKQFKSDPAFKAQFNEALK